MSFIWQHAVFSLIGADAAFAVSRKQEIIASIVVRLG